MAILQIAMPFAGANALRKPASVAGTRGFQGRRTARVSCQQRSVQGSGSESDGSQEAVNILQSSRNPLLNLSREDLIAVFAENEDHGAGVVASAADPSAPASGERRRSERVLFTAEKARLLRKQTRETQTFHDKWYHSAIASKLATPE